LRDDSGDDELIAELQRIVWKKEPGHQIGQPGFVQPERSMSGIGG
ncbi:MAG: GTP 3',8-cyclase MoaA, partial [Verrucomicrobiales bacterium]|nr:GTP 3',8-cyclase MoaA [Verrucomicrobiales bacterium]